MGWASAPYIQTSLQGSRGALPHGLPAAGLVDAGTGLNLPTEALRSRANVAFKSTACVVSGAEKLGQTSSRILGRRRRGVGGDRGPVRTPPQVNGCMMGLGARFARWPASPAPPPLPGCTLGPPGGSA